MKTNIKINVICLIILMQVVTAEYTFETCYKCAEKNDKKICDMGGFVRNAWTGACCSLDDESTECEEGDSN